MCDQRASGHLLVSPAGLLVQGPCPGLPWPHVVRGPTAAVVAVVLGSLTTACSDVVVDSIVVERARGGPQVPSPRFRAVGSGTSECMGQCHFDWSSLMPGTPDHPLIKDSPEGGMALL